MYSVLFFWNRLISDVLVYAVSASRNCKFRKDYSDKKSSEVPGQRRRLFFPEVISQQIRKPSLGWGEPGNIFRKGVVFLEGRRVSE